MLIQPISGHIADKLLNAAQPRITRSTSTPCAGSNQIPFWAWSIWTAVPTTTTSVNPG